MGVPLEGAPAAGRGIASGHRVSFLAVNLGYLAATCAESLLAPVFPVASGDLGLDLRDAGFAFALLAGAIAVGNVVGGALLNRAGPKPSALAGLLLAAAGAALAAGSDGSASFLSAQALLGLGAGSFFAPGLFAAGALAGDRRGLAMGFFGVAFSAGLALAAILAVVGGVRGWRLAFWAASGIALVAAASLAPAALPGRAPRSPRGSWAQLRRSMGLPLLVGATAAGSQYGTNAFLPAFAVSAWGLSPAAAAGILAVARALSVVAKIVAGHDADRRGALATAGHVGLLLALLGAWWTLAPGPLVAAAPAVAFAASVSALGPLANLLALEAFGGQGTVIGAWRSAQIALGAAASALLGAASAAVGLRPALAVAALLPIVLTVVARRRTVRRCRRPRRGAAPPR